MLCMHCTAASPCEVGLHEKAILLGTQHAQRAGWLAHRGRNRVQAGARDALPRHRLCRPLPHEDVRRTRQAPTSRRSRHVCCNVSLVQRYDLEYGTRRVEMQAKWTLICVTCTGWEKDMKILVTTGETLPIRQSSGHILRWIKIKSFVIFFAALQ